MNISNKPNTLTFLVILCGVVSAGLGLLGILSWATENPELASVDPNYVPMAPLTGLLFVVLGGLLCWRGLVPAGLLRPMAVAPPAAAVVVIGLLGVMDYLTGWGVNPEGALFEAGQKLGAIPLFRMSPLTGALFCLAALAQIILPPRPGGAAKTGVATTLATITACGGFIATTGYLFGTPLLYGGSFIPLAATTSLGFIALGVGAIAACGPDSFLVGPLVGDSPQARLLRVFLPLTMALVLLHGLVATRFADMLGVNRALLSATLALTFTAATGLVVIWRSRDIAEAIDGAQASLRESEKKFAKAFAASPAMMAITRVDDGAILEANQAFMNTTGYEAHELVGHGTLELGLWANPAERLEVLERFDTNQPIRDLDVHLRDKSGKERVVMFSAERIQVSGQDIMLTVAVEVTAQRQAQDALRASEAKYRSLYDSMIDGFAVTNMDGVIVEFNESFRAMLGYEPEELRRLSYKDLTPERWHLAEEAILRQQVLSRGFSDVYEKEYLRRDGSTFPVELRVFLIRDAAGRPTAMWGIVRDITERVKAAEEKHKLEMQLLQAQKMEAVGILAGGIAHDFNNILGTILGSAELCMDATLERGDDVSDIEQIVSSVERAKTLVRQILTFSRKVKPEFTPLDINAAVQNAVAVLQRTLPKMIDIQLRLSPTLTPVRADANQLDQVIFNLASNAAHAMPDGGTITITTDNVSASDELCPGCGQLFSGTFMRLTFADQGVGMDKETIAKIFDPFFTTKEVGKGTGLGLSTVYGIVKSHGGHVRCDSEPGHGSAFVIYLPAHLDAVDPADDEDSRPLEPDTPGGNETILVVDDEPALRNFARRALEGAGYQVLEAQSGETALELLDQLLAQPDLIIMDLGMPGMGGFRCVKEILARNPLARIVIASGYADMEQAQQLLSQGVNGFLAKPFKRADLLKNVRSVLDRQPEAG